MSIGWRIKRNGAFMRRRDARISDLKAKNLFSGCSPETIYVVYAEAISGMPEQLPTGAILVLCDDPNGNLVLARGANTYFRVLDRTAESLRRTVGKNLRSLIGQVVSGPDEYQIYEVHMRLVRTN